MKRKSKLRTTRYTAWARKDGKQYSSMVLAYSAPSAKKLALEIYPPEKGYTDHCGQKRL